MTWQIKKQQRSIILVAHIPVYFLRTNLTVNRLLEMEIHVKHG